MQVPFRMLRAVMALVAVLAVLVAGTSGAQAAVSLRGCSAGNGSAFWPYTVSFPKPAGTVQGDLIVIHAAVSAFYSAGGPPSGFTELHSDSSPTAFTWYKIAGASEPSSYSTQSMPATSTTRGIITSWSGVNTAAPLDGSARGAGSGTSVALAGTGVSVPRGGDLRVSATLAGGANTATYSGMTKASCQDTSSPGVSVAYESVGTGTLAARTATLSSNTSWASHTMLLRAAATAPSITGLSPSSGPTTGGTSVVISGTDLSGTTQVQFGGVNATSFTVTNDSQITAIAPPGTGTQDVSVTTPLGSSPNTANDNFTYLPCGGGPLSFSDQNVTFPATALSGVDQVRTATARVNVSDLTGGAAGWRVSLGATPFTNGGSTIPASAVRILGASPAPLSGTCATTSPAAISYPVTMPTSPATTRVFSAAAGSGLGAFDLDLSVELRVPASARIGTYSSTWTFDLTSGP